MISDIRAAVFIGLFTFSLFCTASCDSPPLSSPETSQGNRPIVGFITGGHTPFWKAAEIGANYSAAQNELQLLSDEIDDPNNPDEFETSIRNLSSRRASGIIIAVKNELLIRESVKRARDQGIYVIFFDSPASSEVEDDMSPISVVATDQVQAGRSAADEMARQLGEKGRVAMIRYSPMSRATKDREEGFLTQIRSYPEIEVVSHDFYAGTDVRIARDKLSNFLRLFTMGKKSNLDGIFLSEEATACEMLSVIEEAKLDEKIVFVAFGTDHRLITGILTYMVDALFVEQSARMGQLAVDTMADLLREKPTEPFLDSGAYCITIDNLYTPYTQALINPTAEGAQEILLANPPDPADIPDSEASREIVPEEKQPE